LYVVAYLDRVNFGYAALQMNGDLGITAEIFGFLSGIFFIGYFIFEVPSNLVLKRVGARVWIARIMVSWGIVVILTAAASGAFELAILRFVLGIAEAGFFPGLILYLTGWFRQRDLAQAVALFMTALAVSNIVGAPVSTWILDNVAWAGIAGWRWLFVIEGIPAIALGAATLLYLTDRPEDARWLNEDEKAWLVGELGREEEVRIRGGAGTQIREALTGRETWRLGLVYCMLVIGLYGTGFWMPQIIQSLNPGLTNFSVGMIMTIPFLAALVAMILWSRHSDCCGERRWHTAVPALASGIALAGAALASDPFVIFGLLIIATIGIFCSFGPFWTLPAAIFCGTGAAAGIAAVNSIGNLGGFIGPSMVGYFATITGSVRSGLFAIGCCLVAGGLLALAVRRGAGKNDVPAAL
jgi:ACS family tartrate transporter-like MFS transporter